MTSVNTTPPANQTSRAQSRHDAREQATRNATARETDERRFQEARKKTQSESKPPPSRRGDSATAKQTKQTKQAKQAKQEKHQASQTTGAPPASENRTREPVQERRREQDTDGGHETPGDRILQNFYAPEDAQASSSADAAQTARTMDHVEAAREIDRLSEQVLIASAQTAENTRIRITLRQDVLNGATLEIYKNPGGRLQLNFHTSSPDTRALLVRHRKALAERVSTRSARSVDVLITDPEENDTP